MLTTMMSITGRESRLFAGALVVLALSSLLQLFIKLRRIRAAGHSSSSGEDGHQLPFPRGPPAWPIIGHLPLLQAGCPHQTLADLSRNHGYGPIIGLRLGSTPAVVVSSIALAKDILSTHDKTFASRPPYQFSDCVYYGYDSGVIYGPYGPHWSMLRKIYTLELFTVKRLHDLQHVRQEEIAHLLHAFRQASHNGMQAVDVGKIVGEMSSNTTVRLLQSKPLSGMAPQASRHNGKLNSFMLADLIKELEHEIAPTLGDLIPWLKCLDVIQKRGMQHLHDRLDKVIESMLVERRQAMRTTPPDELPHDFLQVLLSQEITEDVQHQALQKEHLTTRDIKAAVLDILSAGIHTTSLTLEWAMAELLRNPRCLQKLRDEIDAVMGKGNNLVTDEDVHKLPYLECVVKEVFRLHPVAPLLLPRISTKACKVDNYMLPKGTHVFVNVWAIARDPLLWEKAESFIPERFEGKDMDVRGQHYELLPFGSGRRICPALRMGLSVVQLTIANLAKAFDWELPPGQMPTSVDMLERRGITSCKAVPVLAIPKPRAF